jgi:hypothetical protein
MRTRSITAIAMGFVAGAAMATPTLINEDLESGVADFDAAVRAAGGLLGTQPMHGLQAGASRWVFDDFTISASDGRARFVEDDYRSLRDQQVRGAMSGWAIGLSVNDPPAQWGLTFDFNRPVNAFGLEVGDWATCCFSSALYIAFDGGATRQVASASGPNGNPGFVTYGQFTNFVGAFDTGGSFTRVTFYGDGLGEYMVGGGTIRYSALAVSALDTAPPSPVPAPAVWTLVLAALLGMEAAARVGRHLQLGWVARQRSLRQRAA